MSFVTEEDDDFGPPNSNSKLSSLFRDSLSLPTDNKALTYNAPKRPGNQQPQQVKHVSSPTDQEVLAAAAVTCYKLNNEKYEALYGKVGLALLGNHEKSSFSIILYLNKQKPISTTRITKDFKFVSLPDNFCTFYDDARQNWAVLLDSNDVAKKFISEIDRILGLLGTGVAPLKDTVAPIDAERTPENHEDAAGSSKTKLISRMAKLGQPILPLKGALIAEDSDSDTAVPSSTETEQESVKPKKPYRPDKPSPQKPFAQPVNENTLVNPVILPASHFSFVNGQASVPAIPYLASSLPYSGPSAGGYANYYETLLSETRTQNSEIRMHLCRIMDKIDHLAQRQEKPQSDVSEFKFGINKLLGQSSQQTEQLAEVLGRVTILGSQITPSNEAIQLETEKKQLSDEWYLERDSLMLTIQTLRDENDQLASLKHTKVQECQDALKKIEQLENENLRLRDGLKEKLSEQKEMLETAHREESEDLKLVINELKAKEEKLTSQQENVIRDLKAKFLSNENVIHNLRKDIEEKTGQLDVACQERALVEEELLHANHQIASLNEDFSRTKKEWSNGTGQGSQASVIDQVKTIMNKVYKEIAKQFLPEQTYSLKDIKLTVGAVIRDTTLTLLNNESDETQESQRVQAQALHKTGFQESIKISNIETTRDVPDEASVSNLNSQLPQRGTPRELEETLVQDARPATPNLTTVLEKSENETKEETMQNTSDCATEKDRASGETALSPIDDKEETGERSGSFEETLQTSLAAANSRYNQVEPMWKPDPPPLPPLRDFDDDNEENWLS